MEERRQDTLYILIETRDGKDTVVHTAKTKESAATSMLVRKRYNKRLKRNAIIRIEIREESDGTCD